MMPEISRNTARWILAAVMLVTLLVYFPSLSNGFTNWDDQDQVFENADIQRLSAENTARVFSSFYVGMYQPVTEQFYAFIYALFGPSPAAFHSFSLLFHLLNILLVFLLVKQFSGKYAPAAITAGLFALNPMQTESVCWVSAFSNLVYTFFFLLALMAYIRYVKKGGVRYLGYAMFLFLLSLLSKASAMAFPLVVLGLDLFYRRRFNRKLILEKLYFFALAVAIGLVIIHAREEAGHIIDMSERFGWGERLLMVVYALAFYIARLFAPAGLSAFHPYPADGLGAEYYIAPLVPLMLLFLWWKLRGEPRRQVVAGLLFFLINIVIVLDLIPVGVQVVKERYAYLPSIGMYYAFGMLLLFLFSVKRKWLSIAIPLVFTGVFAVVSYSRSLSWNDSLSLWNDVLQKYPDASAALINRGNAWQAEEDFNRSVADYTAALEVEPRAADAYMNRGLAYYRMDQPQNAKEDFDRAIALGLQDAETFNNRGLLNASLNRIDAALSDFRQATRIDPGYVDAYINQGLVYTSRNQFKLAFDTYSIALKVDPGSARAYYWRGMMQLSTGQQDAGCRDLNAASSLGWPPEQIPEICK